MGGSFVSYFCVSTDKQSRSGLGIEAQRAPLASYLAGFGAAPLAEFVEVESGKRNGRPELGRALSECRVRKATLVIAELDRRARDAHFLLGLQRSGITFTAADMPNANRLTVSIMAMVASRAGPGSVLIHSRPSSALGRDDMPA
jgi:DNA invertase Pin-like site-specific DNA recombinase